MTLDVHVRVEPQAEGWLQHFSERQRPSISCLMKICPQMPSQPILFSKSDANAPRFESVVTLLGKGHRYSIEELPVRSGSKNKGGELEQLEFV